MPSVTSIAHDESFEADGFDLRKGSEGDPTDQGGAPCVDRLNDYDLTVSHWAILDYIHRCGRVDIPDLVSKAPVDHATTVEIVTGLAELGYIGTVETYSLVATPVGQYVWRRVQQTVRPAAQTGPPLQACAA